jgi:hypothetical protein
MHRLCIRIVLLTMVFVATGLIYVQRNAATEDLPRSSRVGPFTIPLTSYERIPIGTVLVHPDRYHMREIRLAGTVTSTQTELITNRMICGRAHERTTLTVEDDSGQIEVIDQGACGRNTSWLKAPMLKVGQKADFLLQIMLPTSPIPPGSSVEATIRFMDLVRD